MVLTLYGVGMDNHSWIATFHIILNAGIESGKLGWKSANTPDFVHPVIFPVTIEYGKNTVLFCYRQTYFNRSKPSAIAIYGYTNDLSVFIYVMGNV
jgi:hypothetical protein